jgi:hypothetical protein
VSELGKAWAQIRSSSSSSSSSSSTLTNHPHASSPSLSLSLLSQGYDSVYHPRTTKVRPRSEGVLVAWNRDRFNLFRSQPINFNDQFEELRGRDPVLAMDSLQDNVGLLVQLQPWQDGYYVRY